MPLSIAHAVPERLGPDRLAARSAAAARRIGITHVSAYDPADPPLFHPKTNVNGLSVRV